MYLDPGFGGMLLQVVLALVVVSGAIIFSLRRKLRSLFSKKQDQVVQNNVNVSYDNSEDDVIDTLAD